MTFGRYIYCLFVARGVTFAPERSEGANMLLQGPQINNISDCVIIIITNIQGQIIMKSTINLVNDAVH